jgi:hypothetical protein
MHDDDEGCSIAESWRYIDTGLESPRVRAEIRKAFEAAAGHGTHVGRVTQ